MGCEDKVKEIFSYLLNVKNSNDKVIRNILDYEKVYWESELLQSVGCSVNKNSSKEWWLKVNKKCEKLYNQFLKLYLELYKKDEDIEIVWGHGLIVWKFHGQEIVHPVLTTSMKLNFNSEDEAFILTPNNKTAMEIKIFDGIDIPNLGSILQIENRLNNINLDPRSIEYTEKILREFATYLSVDGIIEKEYASLDKVRLLEHPIIYDNPVILIRKNSMRMWQKEITNIISEIDKGYPIPQTVKALVKDIKIEQKESDLKEWKEVGQDLLFPLCANYEQKEIAKRISENYGVVVQGAPGTGKSHTIANLISHLLAHGKRVLVTSQTDRALKVLTDKIPQKIKPLCLSVLGNDNNSLLELNESVKKIIDNMSANPQNLYEEIEKLKTELELCRKNQNLLYIKFKEAQRRENENIKFDGQEYKISDIAKWVKENEKKYSWIEDKVKLEQAMPLSEVEFEKLIHLLNEVDKEDKESIESLIIMFNKLPSTNEICNSVYRFKELSNSYEGYINNIHGWRVPDNNRCNYDNLLRLLEECKTKMEELDKGVFGNILKKYSENKTIRESFNHLAHKSNDYLLMLSKIKNKLRSHDVKIPSNMGFNKFTKDFDIIYKNLNLRGKIGKIFKLIHPEYSYIIKECKVDGKSLENLDQALIVKLYIQEKLIFKELKTLWNDTIKGYGGNLIISESKELALIFIEEYVKKLNCIVDWDKKYKRQIILLLGKISVPENINWYKKDTYNYFIKCLQCIKKLDEYNNLKAYIQVVKKLILTTGKLKELNEASEAIEALDTSRIRIVLNKIESFKIIKNKFLELDKLVDRLRSVCPITVEKIISCSAMCEDNFKDWKNCWKWAKWNSLLNDIYDLNFDSIEDSMEEEKRREKLIIEEIVAKKAWCNQILRTSESKKKSLFSWMQAVKRVGNGTGKMASEYRKIAQSEMEECKSVIPVWIMPLNRVIENVKISKDLFDVIIFDESSQSDIFSICALMRAKKAVIVGDDKQISPEPIGIDQGLIQNLINKHLKDIPQREWFDFQTSFYDTAVRVFPNRLMLKEHFRCLPEIIGFSNDVFYSNKISQLRYAKPYEEFYPTIVPIRVNGGCINQHRVINIPEAECLVEKLVECCKDKRYLGMTMGVISLLGESQGQLIENMIQERIGQEEMRKRKIICGDAYSFQGDERDIMFLSMVISKNTKVPSITKESDIRSFNVATSRAKNQMWVFHSIDLEDLKPDCIRHSLLRYCLNYKKKNNRNKKVEITFRSKFQRDVYELIKSKGYIINNEVNLGPYKIDFVIEGSRSKVAVICEGDSAIDNFSFEESVERKLDMERLGWNFYRIRGSEFYRDCEKSMEKLWGKLREISIEEYKNGNLKVV